MNPDEERHAPQDDLPGSVVSPRGVQPRPELQETVEYQRLVAEYNRLRAEGIPARELIAPIKPGAATHRMREDDMSIVIDGDEETRTS